MRRRPKGPCSAHLQSIKYEICVFIDREIVRDGLTYREAAQILGTSPATVSRVVNKKVNQLTFNQLLLYLERLRPRFKILVSP